MVGVGAGVCVDGASGAVSKTTLEAMLFIGAGLGAGLGASLAWLQLEGNARSILILTTLVALLMGGGGAWAGYEYGANREIECCATSEVGTFSYAAFGATFAANAAVLFLGIAREIITRTR